jgi:hypothetical protein
MASLENETDKWLNFQLICKPEQSGKTFLMIQHIIKDITFPISGKEMINIILCDNNLLLTKQTSQRVDSELSEFVHNGISYSELSSHERAACHDMASAFVAIVAKGVRNIICCTNRRRIDDIYNLVKNLNEDSPFTRDKFHTNIWLDEADKFLEAISDTLIPIVNKYENVHVKLITATPEPLFTKYKYMNVFPIETTTTEQYHGWEDNCIDIRPKKECLEFAEFILTDIAKDKILPGTKWFIPSRTAKNSHGRMKDLCVASNMAVLCVNGDGIILTIPGIHDSISIEKNAEINVTILKLYKKYNLKKYAFAITGNICIGRGISIMSSSFMMDYAILSHYSNKNEASQLAGRMKGNIKGFPGYKEKSCTIYTTDDFHKIAIEWEQKSKNLATIAYKKEQEGNSTVLDKNDFNTCEKNYAYICHATLFTKFKDAVDFLTTKQRDMDCKINIRETKDKLGAIHKLPDGYHVSSKLLKEGQAVGDLTKSDRITLEKANTIDYSRCISSTDKGSRYLILPVYASEDTPPQYVKFQVRYIQFK